MASRKPAPEMKLFTVAEANATLPLVRAIVTDITRLATDLRDWHERLRRLAQSGGRDLSEAHREELQHAQEEFKRTQAQMEVYEQELQELGIELKDYFTGLVDFPSRMNGRTVYLCWRLGEPEVGHWHELSAGFAGRQKLPAPTLSV